MDNLNYQKIVNNGVYKFMGFAVDKLPTQVNEGELLANEEGEKKVVIKEHGTMFIMFEKDNSRYFINNKEIKGYSPETPYGNFLKFVTPHFYGVPFNIAPSIEGYEIEHIVVKQGVVEND